MGKFLALIAAAALVSGCAMNAAGPAVPQFSIEEEIPVGGAGGWDFIAFDPSSHQLFISRGDRVQVWSAATHRLAGDIAPTEGVHGIAFAPELRRGFTTNGKSNSVTVFDLDSLKVQDRISVPGVNPDALLYEPVFNRVYVFNGRSHDAVVLDARSLKVLATVPLGGKPEVGVSDPTGRVFVNIEDTSELVAIDPASYRVNARWSLAPCEEPTGLAIDAKRARLFSTCANQRMAVVDANTGALVAQVPIDAQPDGAAFDADLDIAWSSNGAGTLTMVRRNAQGQYEAVATVTTRPRARTLTLDPATHRVYLVTAKFGAAAAPTAQEPNPRPAMVPDSFEILVVGPR